MKKLGCVTGFCAAFALVLIFAGSASAVNSNLNATFLGGAGNEWGWKIARSSDGSVFVAGIACASFGALPGGLLPANGSSYKGGPVVHSDIFVAKFNSTMTTLEAFTYFGGILDDGFSYDLGSVMIGLAVDSTGTFVYLTGATRSTGLATPGAYQPALAPEIWGAVEHEQDCFIAKFNSSLVLQACTYFGASHEQDAEDIAVSPDGSSVYIVGGTHFYIVSGHDFPITVGFDYQPHGVSGFVAKFDSNLTTLQASTFIDAVRGLSTDQVKAIAIDADGDVYIAGYTGADTGFVRASSSWELFDWVNSGGREGFVMKLYPDLSYWEFGTYIGGNGDDIIRDLVVDSNKNVYAVGETSSTDFPSVQGGTKSEVNAQGGQTAFVIKLNESGGYLNATTRFVGNTILYGADLDDGGNICVTGSGAFTTAGGPFPAMETANTWGIACFDAATLNSMPVATNTAGGFAIDAKGTFGIDLDVVFTGQAHSLTTNMDKIDTMFNGAVDSFTAGFFPGSSANPPNLPNPGDINRNPAEGANVTAAGLFLRLTFSDPDGNSGQIHFKIFDGTFVNCGDPTGFVSEGFSADNVANGTTGNWTPAAALPNGGYTWCAKYEDQFGAKSNDVGGGGFTEIGSFTVVP